MNNQMLYRPRPSMIARSPPIRIPPPSDPSDIYTPPWLRRQSSSAPSNLETLEEDEESQDEVEEDSSSRPYFMQKPAKKKATKKGFLKVDGNEIFKQSLLNATKEKGLEKKCVCNNPEECRLIIYVPPRVYNDYTNTEEVFEMEFDDEEDNSINQLEVENRNYTTNC